MKKLLIIASGLVIASTIAGAVLAGNDADTALLAQISQYRQWTKLNSEPVKVEVPATAADGAVSIPPAALS